MILENNLCRVLAKKMKFTEGEIQNAVKNFKHICSIYQRHYRIIVYI